MKNIIAFISILCLVTSCFPTEWYEPEFTDKKEFHGLEIPANGNTYEVPFWFKFRVTRTSRPVREYLIRARFVIDDVPGEIYNVRGYRSPIYWHYRQIVSAPDKEDAIMYIEVPANESPTVRSVSVQVSIDNIATYGYAPNIHDDYKILEEDEHDWGEWITILDGMQAGTI